MMEEGGKNKNNKQNKGKKCGFKDNNDGSGSKKKPKLECWKYGKTGHFKRDCRSGNKKNNATFYVQVDAIAWWIDSGATTHVCKDRCWFKTYEPVEDESVLYMGDDHFTPVHGKGSVVLEFTSGKLITLLIVLYVPKLRFDYYNNGMFMLNLNKVPEYSGFVYMSSSTIVNSSSWHARLGYVHYKRMLEMSKDDLIPVIGENIGKCNTYRGGEYYDPVFFQSVGIIHEITTPYTPQQNDVTERKNRALKEMVNAMLSYSGPLLGFRTLKEKLWVKRVLIAYFFGYAEYSKAYRFYVVEPNDSISINTIIESRDAIFDENHFSSIPRPKDIILNSDESQRGDHSNDVPSETLEPRKSKRARKAKSYGSDFQLYLVEGSSGQIGSQYSEAINDEIGSIMENNTLVLSELPPGCKPLGFRQKEGIDYFDTYAPVACITTIRLLLALAAIHNLVIHQTDVKTSFLNGDLEEEVYIEQPKGFVMPGNKHKVCKLVKSLYGLKQVPKQWHQKFDEVVFSNGFLLNQSDKCIYRKFDGSGKGVIICLYVDDMLIFRTDQNKVDKTEKFLSSKFSMKDVGEADVILGIKIKRENKGIVITQSHYIDKILKKFNQEDCSPVSTLMDPVEKLMPNTGKPVDQLEYSRAIGCLMYAMTSTRPDIAYAVSRLSRFTSNPSRQHWHAITRVFKYLNYGLSYVVYPSVLEGYLDASWINHVEDSSSTSGWVFLLGGGTISWASKKQTCITGSTIESEFVALVVAGKEAEWLRNLIHEIPIWPRPIALISIHCDSAATLAKAYSHIYNGKSRHLGVRHSMIRELIMNVVISI
ncbi:zinc finger, CCHC-type containing protein [Tanacetum coccineum]|uniref:Zinc finger, CCHC-type containing protein n=1 Tax=Tanacetum coccineum TaxID=301880 RepID=A0ABQ4ZRP1_9ASTR